MTNSPIIYRCGFKDRSYYKVEINPGFVYFIQQIKTEQQGYKVLTCLIKKSIETTDFVDQSHNMFIMAMNRG